MRLLIISIDFPYPPNHGGRYDVWSRILALKKSGVQVFLITWFEITKGDYPTEESIAHVRNIVDGLIMIRMPRDFRRIYNLLKYPSIVAGRILNKVDYQRTLREVATFAPQAIFIETTYPGILALKLGHDISVPVYIRQHNIEHRYMKGQVKLARSWKEKLILSMSVLHLETYESYILSNADGFFDISEIDLNFWKNKGIKNGYWLPPIYFKNHPEIVPVTEKKYDIAFIGNLRSPNNLAGIYWFIEHCLNKITSFLPKVRILLAGSDPSTDLQALCRDHNNLILLSNPDDVSILCTQSKVLINPVQFGSGVNIKSIDMLFQDNPVVCTSIGVQGLPEDFRKVFCVEDDSEKFAEAIISILSIDTMRPCELRNELRALFDDSAIERLSRLIFQPVKQFG